MAILTLKTKTKVLINPRTTQEEYLYMSLLDIVFNGEWYTGRLVYYYLNTNNEMVIVNNPNEDTDSNFTIAQARQIQDGFFPNGIPGTYEDEKLLALAQTAVGYKLDISLPYGLGANGYDIVN